MKDNKQQHVEQVHPEFGRVVVYKTGLGCADCGYDAHTGPCHVYYCRTCGVECVESGCSQHKGQPRVVVQPRSAS